MKKEINILIVDDVPHNVEISGSILQDAGYNVLAALNGQTALKIAKERKIHLVLLDIAMPGLDGYEVCQILKQNKQTKEIPVIFLTAKTQTDDIVKGFKVGGVDYITKPFHSEELLERIKTHLTIQVQKETIKEQNKKLNELNATKDKFFSIIAHDLINPFNSMLGFSDFLIKNFYKYSDEKKLQFVKNIHGAANSSFKLLKNLLTWSRSQRNKLKFVPEKNSLKSIFYEIILLHNTNAKNKDIIIDNLLDEDIFVKADSNMLKTILRNLLSNAIKFTDKGGKITFSARKIPENAFAEISVKDTGIGIDKKNTDNLFNIEKSTSTRGTDNEKGTGLGLIICKEFVEKHGGKIWVKSIPKQGSEFLFTIPLSQPETDKN